VEIMWVFAAMVLGIILWIKTQEPKEW
jgi:hypothetical protein